MTDKAIVEKDIAAIYLGNLRTVEFDLDLPQKGKNGSTITWSSKDDRFIKPSGEVNRPSYGKGDRIIELTAQVNFGEVQETVTFDVTVLEEENDIVVDMIYPIQIDKKIGEPFYLPKDVAVRTEEGDVIPHAVKWEETADLVYDTVGVYQHRGVLAGTDYDVIATVTILDQPCQKWSYKKQVHCYDRQFVRLTEESLVKQAQDRREAYLLSVNNDQMLYNFRQAAGLDTQSAEPMIGWDSPDCLLRGHTTGHYLSALALCYASSGNQKIRLKLDDIINQLDLIQQQFEQQEAFQFGFLSGYNEDQFDQLEDYVPYPQIWAPYYTLHKIFAGLLDCYEITVNKKALKIADKLGDWTYNRLVRLNPDQLKKMWSMYIAGEFGGMNESLATLYGHTKKQIHLTAAKFFDNDRLFFPLQQKVDALGSLHANQHIPQILGTLKLYEVDGEDSYYDLSHFFWKSVTNHHIYAIGGTGEGEMFQQPDVIGQKLSEATAETCASYNMLKLTKDLYEYQPTVEKMDYYERTMLNHILASTDHQPHGGSTYFMPTSPGSKKGFDVENTCCHGTGLENHFKYGESIYYHSEEAVYINLFLSSHLDTEQENIQMSVDETNPSVVHIKVNKLNKKLMVRKPYWALDYTVLINGEEKEDIEANGYLAITAQTGDRIKIHYPTDYRIEETADLPEIVSIGYGPYILAAIDDQKKLQHIGDLDGVKQETGTLLFKQDERLFKPLALINHEAYHLYFKK